MDTGTLLAGARRPLRQDGAQSAGVIPRRKGNLAIVYRFGGGLPPVVRIGRCLGRGPDATQGDQPGKAWSGVTLIEPASTAARNGFGPHDHPKPSLLGAVDVRGRSVRAPADPERNTGISTGVTFGTRG